MTIHLLREKPTEEQLEEMLSEHVDFIKLAVDMRLRILAGGREMHAECEELRLDADCRQDDIWGADWIPHSQRVRYPSFINVRPKLGNRQMEIGDPGLRATVEATVREVFE